MQFFKSLRCRVLALAVAITIVPAAIPSTVPFVGVTKAEARDHGPRFYRGGGHRGGFYGGGRHVRGPYYGGRSHARHYGRHHGSRYYGNRHYGSRYYGRRYRDSGIGIGAAIIGLGVGAAIANSGPRYYREPSYGYAFRSPAWYRYCEARYRSFDPRSGTYQPYNGPRRLCR
ncbi:hypothetical protein Sa4125_31040 [Aureimonas sp. SA4125]|uniref:BA14K family protein n=1 Tax=Aureimonas sp. SA4125 TaxID=2826993 RepID=UPI001CC54AC3|nr:BA14K family protein [Aureimonas sp. SA4125]BDA85562.1 hypothetical protein Sa4125_31040 [Aureimonas sp. SA4125]